MQKSHLHLIHPVHDVQHLLEDSLQAQVEFQSLASSFQELQEVVPQPQNIVFAHRDTLDVMVVLSLQLRGYSHYHLNTLLVRGDVRLDGFVLLGGRLHGLQIKTKVVLEGASNKDEEIFIILTMTSVQKV